MAPKSAIFCEIAVIPWTPFAGDIFSRNLLTAITFDPARRRQFFPKNRRWQRVDIRHFVKMGQVCSKSSASAWLVDIPLAAMHTKIMTQNGLK